MRFSKAWVTNEYLALVFLGPFGASTIGTYKYLRTDGGERGKTDLSYTFFAEHDKRLI